MNSRFTDGGVERLEVAGWDVSLHKNGSIGSRQWGQELALRLVQMQEPEKVLKHDHRSQVGLVTFEDVTYIVKKFTLQRTWLWFQLTSVAFPTLGEIAYDNAIAMAADGLLTPSPSLLLQRVENKMVVESWLVYKYLEGEPATVADGELIVDYISRMHSAGWIHRDPHPGNFLKTAAGLAALDPIRAKKSSNHYLQAYDVMLMAHDIPEAPELYGRERLGVYYTLANSGHSFMRFYRSTKVKLRRAVGLGGHSGNLKAGS